MAPVAAPVTPGRIGEPLLQSPVAGEQQQPLAVGIQPPSRIDPGDLDVIRQAPPSAAVLRCELTEDAEGLVKKECGQKLRCSAQEAWRAFQRFTTPIEIRSNPRSIERGGRTMPAATTIVRADPSDN